jgi:hypothetical protein
MAADKVLFGTDWPVIDPRRGREAEVQAHNLRPEILSPASCATMRCAVFPKMAARMGLHDSPARLSCTMTIGRGIRCRRDPRALHRVAMIQPWRSAAMSLPRSRSGASRKVANLGSRGAGPDARRSRRPRSRPTASPYVEIVASLSDIGVRSSPRSTPRLTRRPNFGQIIEDCDAARDHRPPGLLWPPGRCDNGPTDAGSFSDAAAIL